MIGSSRASIAVVQEAVDAKFDDPDLERAGKDLLDVADLLGREITLRRALSDAGRPAQERRSLASQMLATRVCALADELVGTIVASRWSSESDLVDAVEFAGAQALFGAAEHRDELDRVEEELFRFGRIVVVDGDLQLALSSHALPGSAKRGILVDILSGKATGTTVDLLSFVAAHLRGRRLGQAIDALTAAAAHRRGKLVAVVTSARPLTGEQGSRLAAALERIYSHPVVVNVQIRPSLVGGLSVQIGDEVIDGSIATRLENARRRVSG
ncbi:MAG: F0F1 ATP synthase subunit delta [Candidatus Nanopelagicales bacterium]|nr:F0F1 ATP synthase subunit delta [Candidatus Nanopelagicales bacterium]MDZ4249115.1 F0F1 ATP synthase subunit delta [Candidatus Nanopelagicales bacterium]MDZ7578654.1 F0F1 ATP synthase subunit delta [Candidatus Nanopelagicales bacterium]